MSDLLKNIANYSSDRISLKNISLENYISTENLLQNKQGKNNATNLPPKGEFVTKYEIGDILVSNIRPYLKKIWFANNIGGSSSDVLTIKVNKENNSKFVYYALFRDEFFDYVMAGSKGTKMPRGDKNQVMNFSVPKFDYFSQSQIAKVLSDLDAKIELNNKINAELEAMAKLIYDYWFVQFDFPYEFKTVKTDKEGRRTEFIEVKPYKSSGGKMVWNEELKREIPEGWEVKELSKVLSIKYGKDHKKLNNGIIPVYGSGGVMRYVDEYLYNDETILIPRKGSIGNLFYVNEPFWSVDTMFYTKASKKGSVLYYFYQLSKLNLLTLNVGTAVPSLTVEILNKIKLLAPEQIILEKFNSIIFRNKEKSLSIIKENQKLSELRDWLLPMLMNGQVKVK